MLIIGLNPFLIGNYWIELKILQGQQNCITI